MATLYELEGNWRQVNEMLEDPDMDEQVIWDTLEAIEGEIEAKADGYAKIIRQIEHDADGYDQEIKRMTEQKKTLKNRAASLKQRLQHAMELTGKEKFKTDLFSFGIQNNPPSFKLDAESVYYIPEDFLIYSEPTFDTRKAIQYLKENEADWGHLERGRSLRIR